jgi:predicted amidohydrolase
MILASAQTSPVQHDINANLIDHYRSIEMASKHGAELILFPEMSITGYEREKAKEFAFRENDSRLSELKKLSVKNQIIVIAGAPVKIDKDLYIGAFVIKPDGSVSIYTKQFLHTGEDIYFKSSFDYNPVIEAAEERISLAICADINNPKHPENANKVDSTIYLASIFFEPVDMTKAYKTLSGYAKKFSMSVLMSNFAGRSWDLDSGGQSGFWNKNGELIANLNNIDSGLLLIEKVNNKWIGKKLTAQNY